MVLGDFNSTMDSITESLSPFFVDSFTAANQESPHYTHWQGKRLDYIFLSRNLAGDANECGLTSISGTPIGSFPYQTSASDHIMIISDIMVWNRDAQGMESERLRRQVTLTQSN